MNKEVKKGRATMRPRARLISLLGDELISDEPVAITELVKNSFDADATRVEITFEYSKSETPERIIVTDNGHGMSLETILHGWFEPGTILKHDNAISPEGRTIQGAKGIGRFATARLGSRLILITKKRGIKEHIQTVFEWGKFSGDEYLDEIVIEYETQVNKNIKLGTTLILENIRKKWTNNDFEKLQERLSRLISQFKKIKDFKIILDIPLKHEL